jgi:metallo-beta-lactamase family protein
MTVSVSFFGAARTVTGSCIFLTTDYVRLLVDCGMFQGSKTLKALNYQAFPFAPHSIDAVLLTHAHIDHSGLIPKLIREGFAGPIYATRGTRELCSALLPDAGHIQEFEVEILNRRNMRHGKRTVTPIYTEADGVAALHAFRSVDYGDWCSPAPGVRARFWNAGHILGSASIEIEFEQQGPAGHSLRLLVSGDIGPQEKALQEPPEAPAGVDYIFCESTYGDVDRKLISAVDRRARLASQIHDSLNDEAPLLIPAFAVERTQELLVDLVLLMQSGDVPEAPIFIDSPLATRATEIFIRNARDLDRDVDVSRILRSPLLRFTETVEESREIGNVSGFKIILAGSGMCDAGRIRHHLRRWLWQRKATVLLTGYQAPGTLGRILQDGPDSVRIQGDEVRVRARIVSTDDYSGHADCGELAGWIAARQPIELGLFLTHGEEPAIAGLAKRITGTIQRADAIIRPLLDDVYDLTPTGAQARTPQPPKRISPDLVGRMDWHNDRSRLLLEISALLDSAPSDQARNEIVHQLRRAIEQTSAGVSR